MPKSILEPLKELDGELGIDLVAITSMVDNGGSAGVLRRELNVLPAGDIRRHLLALSEAEEWKKKLWDFRFAKDIEISPLHFGHNFANVFISGLEYLLGDFEKALDICHEFLRVKGRALPATLDKVQLIAELEDGNLVEGEDEIDLGQNHNRNLKVKRVYLQPSGKAYEKAVEEVATADFIIIGPGGFYYSLVPCFLTEGWKEVMAKTQAIKIFICPAMTKLGDTKGYSVRKFADIIEEYIGTELNFVLYNTNILQVERIKKFKEEMKEGFILDPPAINENLDKSKYIGADLLLEEGDMKYDKQKLLGVLRKIINI